MANRTARASGRTPQPPAPLTGVGSPSAPPKSRRSPSSRESARAPSSESHRPPNNNSVKSPRAPPSRSSEPATEDEDDAADRAHDASLDTMHEQLTQMLADVTAKSQKNHKRYTSMRSKATGKDEQIARLHATYEDLSDQLAELETLCNSSSDTNLETLDKLFRSIPRHEQLLASGD